MTIPTLLVVDDDPDLRDMLKAFLTSHGLAVHVAASCSEVTSIVASHRIDLILLDVMLGDENGMDICIKLRASNVVPIIMMSALSSDDYRMQGYSAGADDYIAKPFNPDLLLARIRAVLGRTRRATSLSYRRGHHIYRFGHWQFDSRLSRLTGPDGVEIMLSKREIALLNVLLANPGLALSREEITAGLESDTQLESRALDVAISRLRGKIEADPKCPEIIKTLRGAGYMLAVEVSSP
ncbi:MAG: response regulator transcription factor [Rhodobacteraceae bacterium]|nr:response regulator transcription factor [Paracoccaceae bacterium]